jgi:hypothetical protein
MGLVIENKDLKDVLVVVFVLSCTVLRHFAIILLLVGQALLGMPRWHRKLQKVVTRPFVYSDLPKETPQASSSTWDPANNKDFCNVSG